MGKRHDKRIVGEQRVITLPAVTCDAVDGAMHAPVIVYVSDGMTTQILALNTPCGADAAAAARLGAQTCAGRVEKIRDSLKNQWRRGPPGESWSLEIESAFRDAGKRRGGRDLSRPAPLDPILTRDALFTTRLNRLLRQVGAPSRAKTLVATGGGTVDVMLHFKKFNASMPVWYRWDGKNWILKEKNSWFTRSRGGGRCAPVLVDKALREAFSPGALTAAARLGRDFSYTPPSLPDDHSAKIHYMMRADVRKRLTDDVRPKANTGVQAQASQAAAAAP